MPRQQASMLLVEFMSIAPCAAAAAAVVPVHCRQFTSLHCQRGLQARPEDRRAAWNLAEQRAAGGSGDDAAAAAASDIDCVAFQEGALAAAGVSLRICAPAVHAQLCQV